MKPETEIRNLKRSLHIVQGEVADLRIDRDRWMRRATGAEQEAAEWKKRFDELLSKCIALAPRPE